MDFVDRYKELGMDRNFYFSALAETITEQCNAFSLSVGAGVLINNKNTSERQRTSTVLVIARFDTVQCWPTLLPTSKVVVGSQGGCRCHVTCY